MDNKKAEKKTKGKLAFSKKLINDVRSLLWIVTVGGILLAFYCVYKDYTSSLPWVSAMVGLPWASHATICSLYLNKSKAENTGADGAGIVFAAAQAKNFIEEYEENKQKYTSEESINQLESSEEYTSDDYYVNSPPI